MVKNEATETNARFPFIENITRNVTQMDQKKPIFVTLPTMSFIGEFLYLSDWKSDISQQVPQRTSK